MKRLGRYTLLFERRPAILGHAAVCGKKEAAGPLARDFDQTFLDSYLNQESWEKAESMLQTEAANLAIRKAGLQKQDINMVFAGDLLNQCISSTFGLRGMEDVYKRQEESAMMALPCFVWARAMRPMMANVISGVP